MIRGSKRRLAATALVAAVALAAWAAPTASPAGGGEAVLEAAVPQGACRIDPGQARRDGMLERVRRALGGRVELVTIFADCAELAAFEAGERAGLERFGYVYAIGPAQTGGPVPAREELFAAIRRLAAGDGHEAESAPGELPGAVEVVERLGVLGEDAHGIYAGDVYRLPAAEAEAAAKTEAAVYGVNVLAGHVVTAYLWAPHEGAATAGRLHRRLKRYMAALAAANAGE